ncbi:arylsulfatase [Candidatus Poriferisodalis sp.]|uniref:arylsulfatase n=1 Tax=Candidatus Poriferisodalis sp. TaxID=3101277 RepID=UPI003B5B650D
MSTPKVGTTVHESTPGWDPPRRPPPGAPNVVVIVLDDTGFAQLGCFGSDIDTPNIDRLANGGLRYTNFHTTALCSPTRACLLTGRNHHSVGMRFVSNVDSGFSNSRGAISPKAATMAEMLREHGYGTFALGKWHLATLEDCSPAGPMDHWPLQRGFDRYYGFLGPATDQFSPELSIDNHPIDPPSQAGYHVSEDLVDQAIAMITAHQGSAPGRRFFAYVAFGATHSPHQAPRNYIEKYRGRYDDGWDIVRRRWFERQLALGVVPEGTILAPRNPGVEPWDELPDANKAIYLRMQEAFAGLLDHTDDQIGRLIDFLEKIDVLDDTIVMLVSDNGASQEGGKHGTLNELAYFNEIETAIEGMLERVDEIGGPNIYNNYPWGWAQVGNTPLRFYKQNTYEGGIRDPLIVHWPNGISDAGGLRDQYHHTIDLLPTVLECVGVEAPETYRGVAQMPVEGTSLRYTFDSPSAPTRRTTQYYEMIGHRAIWHDGWKAVTMHAPGTPYEDDQWALYHTDVDFSECVDLAGTHPDKVRELVNRWWSEAGKYNVMPLDDRRGGDAIVRRRSGHGPPGKTQRFYAGTPHLQRGKTPDIRNRSFRITARVTRADGDGGVLVAYGARTTGLTFFVQDDHLWFTYNRLGQMFDVRSDTPLPEGELDLVVTFTKTAQAQGTAELSCVRDGTATEMGRGPVEMVPYRETLYGMDIGKDAGPTVTDAYQGPFPFTGRLEWVEYELEDDRDDLIKAAEVELKNQLADQ